MGKKIAVVQSNYIPWKGYFDLIRAVDEFILYDDAQYTPRDWRNRNCIKTKHGAAWITIPVELKDDHHPLIKDVKISDADWGPHHWKAITRAYGKADHFKELQPIFEPLYLDNHERSLSRVNRRFIDTVNSLLSIRTKVSFSMDYDWDRSGERNEKLVSLCQSVGADEYLSGPSAKTYMDQALFEKKGIQVRFADYSGYPAYAQHFGPFVHEVSILDLLFNQGKRALEYMKAL